MSSPRIDRSDDHPRALPRTALPRLEPVLASTAAAAAISAQLVTDVDAVWVLLDLAAVLAAVFALALLLRALAVERGRPALAEAATGVVTAGICTAVLLLAQHGPEAYLGAVLLEIAAAMGTVLTLLILSGAWVRHLRERRAPAAPPSTPAVDAGPRVGRLAGWVTVVAATVAVVAVAKDVTLR